MIRAAVAFVLVMTFAVVARAQTVTPGPLATDHSALEGIDNCKRCHTGGGNEVSATSCLSCHKALGQQLAAKAGYHATLGSNCGTCHPDHRGVSAALVRWPGGRDHFDHDHTGYKLLAGHAKVACRDCHNTKFLTDPIAKALTADERPRTYLGAATVCSSCHADVHKPSLGADCTKCHDATSWHVATTTSTGFDHDKTKYPLVGAHAKVECTKCHNGTKQKLAKLHPAFDTCKTCHADPHAGTMGTAPAACATCHREAAWKELHYNRTSHAPRTLPLTAGHAKPTCAACHGDKLDRKVVATCTPCHADPHKPSLGTQCESCHQTTSWAAAAAMKIAFHDKTTYPLRGLHVTVACDKCHDPKKPTAQRFRPLAHGKCLDCHPDVHKGEASKPCEGCHTVGGWQPATFEVVDHAKTRFVLDGAHRAVPCAKCHPSSPKPSNFKQGNPSCLTCHADPHAGQFVDKGTCETCHDVKAWSPSTFTKEAHAKAGLALVGKHAVACARCHDKKFVGLSSDCGTCHDDRHAGQFAGRTCMTCHAGAEWKPTPGFDHSKTFVLHGRHATADCVTCHPKRTVHVSAAKSVETDVYKLGPASHDCVSCHRAQHGDPKSGIDQPRQLAAATRACQTCHGETTWRTLAIEAFDHGTTGTPLVGGHAKTSCASCHQPDRRKLPELVACAGCHQDRHAGRLGDRCERCHSAASWKQDQLLVDHQRTRLPLVGAHAVQPCASCHKDAQAGTFRGLDPSCRSCHFHTVIDRRPHPDHTKDNGFNNCEDCHSVLGWRPAHIDHDKFYPLTGKHATIACVACHKTGDPYNAAPTQCLGCHAADETTANTNALFMHATNGPICGDCHTTTMWTNTTFNHLQFPTNHHDSVCANCHSTATMPQMYTCVGSGCHNSTADRNPGSGHHGGDQNCARSGCHYGGSGG